MYKNIIIQKLAGIGQFDKILDVPLYWYNSRWACFSNLNSADAKVYKNQFKSGHNSKI